jgi:hypothetical protein
MTNASNCCFSYVQYKNWEILNSNEYIYCGLMGIIIVGSQSMTGGVEAGLKNHMQTKGIKFRLNLLKLILQVHSPPMWVLDN